MLTMKNCVCDYKSGGDKRGSEHRGRVVIMKEIVGVKDVKD